MRSSVTDAYPGRRLPIYAPQVPTSGLRVNSGCWWRRAAHMATCNNFRATFAVACLAFFVFALDRLVVTTALPVIRADLGASFADLEWTVNAYTLSFAVLVLTGAALGDRFGRRRVFVVGVCVFTAASIAGAVAPSIGALIAARAVQGVGGALFTPVTLTMLTAATAPDRRGKVLGAWGGIGGLGAALGPLVGGGLAGTADWRLIFWVNVPVGLVLVPLAQRSLTESRGRNAELDLCGVLLGSGGLFGVVWGLVRGNAAGWTSAEVVLTTGVGALLLVAFVLWEQRTSRAILPTRFFRNRVFATAGLASVLMYSALFGALFLVAQLLQIGLGATPLVAGLETLPAAAMPFAVAPLAGVLSDRIGTRPLMISGLLLEATALAWFALAVVPGVGYPTLVPPLVLMGAGSAVFFAPLAAATLGAVAPHEHGQASGTVHTFREVAVVLGVAALGLVFARYGGYSSPARFVAGFVPAMRLAAVLAAVGVVVALVLPTTAAAHDTA
jgi:EmrB/QacA subfamily drug resistance transporter